MLYLSFPNMGWETITSLVTANSFAHFLRQKIKDHPQLGSPVTQEDVHMPPVLPSYQQQGEQDGVRPGCTAKELHTQISTAWSRGSHELKYKVIHICYKAYKYRFIGWTEMHEVQCLTVAEEGGQETIPIFSKRNESACLPVAESEHFSSREDFNHIITNISPNRELRAAAPNTLRFTQSIVTPPTPFHTEQMPNISWTERAGFMQRDHRRGRLSGLFLKYNSFNSQARCCCLVSGN